MCTPPYRFSMQMDDDMLVPFADRFPKLVSKVQHPIPFEMQAFEPALLVLLRCTVHFILQALE